MRGSYTTDYFRLNATICLLSLVTMKKHDGYFSNMRGCKGTIDKRAENRDGETIMKFYVSCRLEEHKQSNLKVYR
eukprot:m.502645 g.502645  ORF g.502645 m.502645 type:complete len:75 (-) comp21843_c0_seq12:2299-2523(-)